MLHCPTAVGGHPSALSKAERSLGLESTLVVGSDNFLKYRVDVVLGLGTSYLANQWKLWRFFLGRWLLTDVVHYNFGSYLFQTGGASSERRGWLKRAFRALYIEPVEGIDLRLARRLGKVVAVTYQGDDARQGDVCRAAYPIHFAHEVDQTYYPTGSDDEKRRRIARVDRYAHIIYALNPDLLRVLPERARFLPYATVDPQEIEPSPPEISPDIPHIVHAPTHRVVKGTKYLLAALDRLRADGVPFKLTLIENLSNDQALEIYRSADLVVDQLLAGFYGGFAVEVMAMAKPVIAYLRSEDIVRLPEDMQADMPIINAEPATIESVLREYLTVRKHELRERGIAGRRYAERWHDPARIAQHVAADYERALAQ